jgi:uncharacterized protein YbjT (DUF2867 family)
MLIGAQDDDGFLVKATEDIDALLWVTPPGYGSDNVRAFQNRLGKAAATAIRANHIPRIVNLSSMGAQFSSGVGPINGLHDVEELLNDAADNVMHLRPGFFFENLLWQADSIKSSSKFSLPISSFRRYPMIATRDIGAVAARRLVDDEWTGQSASELHGAADLSYDEVAGVLSKALGRRIIYTKCGRQELRQALLGNAISENTVDLMLEMYDAVEAGKLRPAQPRSEETTTPTTLLEFVYDVLIPMIAAPAIH